MIVKFNIQMFEYSHDSTTNLHRISSDFNYKISNVRFYTSRFPRSSPTLSFVSTLAYARKANLHSSKLFFARTIFYTTYPRLYICKFPRSMNSREAEKRRAFREKRERKKGGGGSRNDPPRRDCSSLHAWKQAERGHVSSGCRGDSAGFSSRCTKITSLPLSLSLSLSRTHTHSLCPLFKAPLMPGTEKSPRWSVPRCRSGSAN